MQKMKRKIQKKVAFIAPSGAIDEVVLNSAKDKFEKEGYEVVIYPTCYKKHRIFAGTDEERVQDIENAFSNQEGGAIICARGGYGTIKILDKINPKIIKNNQKIFCGFSDITALLAFFHTLGVKKLYHSPMCKFITRIDSFSDFEYTTKKIKQKIIPNMDFERINPKSAKGLLWGGNLATIVSLFGADKKTYMPKNDIILFLEDLNEPVYKIDKMMTQILRNKELAKKIKAIVVGEFSGLKFKDFKYILNNCSEKLKVPVFYGYNISHNKNTECVPFGEKASISEHGVISL